MRTDLIGRREMCISLKKFSVSHVDVRQIDGGAPGTHTFDLPPAEHQPRFKSFFDEIVKGSPFVFNLSGHFQRYPLKFLSDIRGG